MSLREKIYNTLRWSERYTKTDMVYAAKGNFWLTILQVVSTLSAFFLSVAFANLFPKHEYGIYKYIISLGGIIGAFSLTGLSTAIMTAVAQGKEGALREGFFINLRWSWGIIGASLLGAIYYYSQDNLTLAISLIIVGAFTPFLSSGALYGAFLNGKKDFKRISLYGVIRNLIPVALLILSVFFTDNPILIVLVYFLSNTFVNLLCFLLTAKKYNAPRTKDGEILSYSKHLSLMSILNIIADNIDKVIVFQFVGSVELAVYTFATSIPLQIKGVLKNVYTLAFPRLAMRTLDEIKSSIGEKMIRFTLMIVPIVILYIFAAPFIYKIFFPKYLDAILYSQVFALSLLFYTSILPTTALQAKKAVASLYQANIFIAITKIVILAIFTYLYGLWGVIIARVLYEIFALFIASFLLKRARVS